MRVQVLGPLRVATGDGLLEPAGQLQRQLLGLLVAAGGRPLSADLLMDSLWGPAPDERRGHRLQVQVHRVRKLLDDPGRLGHGPLGYSLELVAEEVDARDFEVTVERASASTDADAAILGLERALALWSGAAYEGIADPLVEAEARRLSDLRLDTIEALATRQLDAGRPDVAAELVAASMSEHPWREGLALVRLAALARLGRQREALEVFQAVRAALVEELGIEPGPALQEAQAAVLAGRAVEVAAERPAMLIPSQLPQPPAVFTGRVEEEALLDAALLSGGAITGARIAVISGMAGVGKSALALRWAREHESAFPDGVVHLDLRGWSTDRPVPVETALGRVLRSYGVTPASDDEHELSARLRSLLRDRKALFLLDNAATVDQVRPLLPSAPGCAVVVTSRERMPPLVAHEGAVPIVLKPLGESHAVALLAEVLGDLGSDTKALTQLADRCAHLPLALRVAAEYVRSRPVLGLHGLLRELDDDAARLDILDENAEVGIRDLFARSYERLDESAAAAFRLFGVLPVADVDLPALAAMMGEERRTARSAVDALMRAHLVFERPGRPGSPRYGTHDLLAAFATELAEQVDGDASQAALDRLFDHYATGAVRAAAVLDSEIAAANPSSDFGRIELAASGGVAGPDLPDADAATAWLTTEISSLVAAAAAASPAVDERLCATAGVMHTHLYHSGTGGRALGRDLQRIAIRAAGRRRDERELSRRYNSVAFYEADLWQLDDARAHFAAAVTVLGEHATAHSRSSASHNESILLIWEGRNSEAIQLLEKAVALAREYAAVPEQQVAWTDPKELDGDLANSVNTLAWALIAAGRLDEAEAALVEAFDLAKAAERVLVQCLVTQNLSRLELARGDLERALAHAEEFVEMAESERLGGWLGESWNQLGAVHTARGHGDLAIPLHRRALRDSRDSGNRGLEVESLVGLAEAHLAIGDHGAALRAFRDTVAKGDGPEAIGDRVRALSGLATTYAAIDLPSAARECLERAIALCEPTDLDAAPLESALAALS